MDEKCCGLPQEGCGEFVCGGVYNMLKVTFFIVVVGVPPEWQVGKTLAGQKKLQRKTQDEVVDCDYYVGLVHLSARGMGEERT